MDWFYCFWLEEFMLDLFGVALGMRVGCLSPDISSDGNKVTGVNTPIPKVT